MTSAGVQAVQTFVAALTAIFVAGRLDSHMVPWAAISAALVLRSDHAGTRQAGLERFAANMIGATVGFGVSFAVGVHPLSAAAAMALSVFACHAVRLGQSARSACACTAILMLAGGSTFDWHRALLRVAAVSLGSVLAVLIMEIWIFCARTLRVGRA